MPRAAAFALLLCACDGVFGLQHVQGDDGTGQAIAVESVGHAHGKEVTMVTVPVMGVAQPDLVLVVFAAVGSYCTDLLVGSATLTFAGSSPSPFHLMTGTPCDDALSHSYVWVIANPASGTHDAVITLDAPARSLHAGALLLSGVDTASPIRSIVDASERSQGSSLQVTSAAGDLVVSLVGQGGTISSAGLDETVRYIDNVDAATTLNNTGMSTQDGDSPSVNTTWTFGVIDEWQAMALSVRPAP